VRVLLKDKIECGVKLMMLSGLIQILFFQSLGELISKLLLPSLPGPVIGLVLLLCWLMIKKEINPSLALVSDALSQYLGLLFVPAAVGIVLFLPQLKDNALPIICGLIGSVVLTIGGSALVLKLFNQGKDSND
jgi:putative effector of murein hydrolase LrgA (UPF0299 family)